VNDRACRTVVDTGAVITLVRRGFLSGPPPPKANLRIRGVSGDVADAFGPRRATFQFGQVPVAWGVFEVDMPEDCLLGANLMVHMKAYVDMGYAEFVLRQQGPGRTLPRPLALPFTPAPELPALYHFDAYLCIRSAVELRVPPSGECSTRALLRSDWHPPARRPPGPPLEEDGPLGSGSSGYASSDRGVPPRAVGVEALTSAPPAEGIGAPGCARAVPGGGTGARARAMPGTPAVEPAGRARFKAAGDAWPPNTRFGLLLDATHDEDGRHEGARPAPCAAVSVRPGVVPCVRENVELTLANPTEYPVVIPRHAVIAEVYLIGLQPDEALPRPPGPPAAAAPIRRVERDRTPIALGVPLPPALQELLDKATDLDVEQRENADGFLREFHDVFSKDGEYGFCDLVEVPIDTGDARPNAQPARPIPIHMRAEVRKQFEAYLRDGAIVPSTSDWASPLVLVKKKDGTLRICTDFRMLNSVMRGTALPLPRTDVLLEELGGHEWYCAGDFVWGYHNLKIAERDRHKTAIIVPGMGLFEYVVLPFGLKTAPGIFQSVMQRVLYDPLPDGAVEAPVPDTTTAVYLDDLAVAGMTFAGTLTRMRQVFSRIRRSGLLLKPKKCSLFTRSLRYLGHVVSAAGVAVDPEKTAKIHDWPTPRSKDDVHSFLGLCGYYQNYVPRYTEIARPLQRLTRLYVPFEWTPDTATAFVALKKALTSPPILATATASNGRFVLDTDCSAFALGAVLSQIQQGEERVIAYHSRALTVAETKLCVTMRELLAVVDSVRKFHFYLAGAPEFLIRSDHAALQWLKKFRNLDGKLARWVERLESYSYVLEFRKGSQMAHADALSRYPYPTPELRPCPETCPKCSRLEQKEEDTFQHRCADIRRTAVVPDPDWSGDELRAAQGLDPGIKTILDAMEHDGDRPSRETAESYSWEAHCLWQQWQSLSLRHGLLYREWRHPTVPNRITWQLVLPRCKVREAVTTYHGAPGTGSHFGVRKSLSTLRARFYWPGMYDDVRDVINACETCTRKNGPSRRTRAPLRGILTGTCRAKWYVDILGPLPRSTNGNRYCLVAIDSFSGWPEVMAVRTITADIVAGALVRDVFSRYGAPRVVHTDQGRQFEARLFAEVMALFGIRKSRSLALHPSSNGKVERFMRVITGHLARMIREDQRDWDEVVPLIMMAYRAMPHNATKYSPAEVMFGHNITLPADLSRLPPPDAADVEDDPARYPAWLRERLRDIHEDVRRNMTAAQSRAKDHYDAAGTFNPIREGQEVWLYAPRRRVGRNPKLECPWEGPYRVERAINDVVMQIRPLFKTASQRRARDKIVHADRLAPLRDIPALSRQNTQRQQC